MMPLPEDHPLRKDLPPLGHEAALWLRAMKLLRLRLEKGRLPANLGAFLQLWLPGDALPEDLPPRFVWVLEGGHLQAGPLPCFDDVRWHALLRLPALRSFWVAELRASHHAHLLKLARPVWLMDETPLPPGSVISGLGIPSWEHLPRLAQQGRHFHEQRLDDGQRVLMERLPSAGARVQAAYEVRAGKIVLAEAMEVAV